MKKSILLLVLLSTGLVLFAGGKKKFQQAMQKSLVKYAACESPADYVALGNEFERIGEAEKKEWLPRYYRAYSYVLASFTEEDPAQKDAYLDVAEEVLGELVEMEPKESEVYALQAMFMTARLTVDPMTRGPEYSMLSDMAIRKALKFNPNNPRAKYMDLSMKMGRADFFGEDPSQYCADVAALAGRWDEFEPASPIHPTWGKEQVAGMQQQQCQ